MSEVDEIVKREWAKAHGAGRSMDSPKALAMGGYRVVPEKWHDEAFQLFREQFQREKATGDTETPA